MADDDVTMTNEERVAHWQRITAANRKLGGAVWRPITVPGSKLDLPPVANGLDYLVSVVDLLGPDDEGEPPSASALKYAVLHLDAAAEVLLKARLEIEHWSLVLGKVDKGTTYAKYKAGDFYSVGTEEALRRLRQMAEVDVPTEGDISLTALGKLRNQLQHYGLVATREEIEPVAAKVLDFLVAFLDGHLLPAADPVAQAAAGNDMLHVRHGLNRIQGYVDERLSRLGADLEGLEDRTVQCTRCFQDTLVAGDGIAPATVRCRFCQTGFTPQEIANEYEEVNLGGLLYRGGQASCEHCGLTESVARFVVRVTEMRAAPKGSHVYDHVIFCFACALPATVVVPTTRDAPGPR
ncbi:hypothetical protein [Streptomyces goshikiensis]|uniref:hypothetical protein n=1 Tax=Streptomyces goshikiensis TaxID=1942 RepID=UPI0036890664